MEKNFKKALALLTAIAIVGGANYVPQNENFSIKKIFQCFKIFDPI